MHKTTLNGDRVTADTYPDLPLLKRIRLDGGTQHRDERDDVVVARVAKYRKCLDRLPPVLLVYDGKWYWPWDGHLRIRAYLKEGRADINAVVRRGTRDDAILLSLGANDDHGLPRSDEDIRRAVETVLRHPEWSQEPNTWIAARCNIDESTVRKHKLRLSGGKKTEKEDDSDTRDSQLPEEFLEAFDRMDDDRKMEFVQEQEKQILRKQSKQDAGGWLEKTQKAIERVRKQFAVKANIEGRDRRAIERAVDLFHRIAERAAK